MTCPYLRCAIWATIREHACGEGSFVERSDLLTQLQRILVEVIASEPSVDARIEDAERCSLIVRVAAVSQPYFAAPADIEMVTRQ